MADQEQDNANRPFHDEGGAIIFDKPPSAEETRRQAREDEQHEFARSQVKTNKILAWFTGALVLATFCTIGVGVWQATISQRASNAAKSAADTAAQTLKEMQMGQGATDTHTLAEQAKNQTAQTTNLATAAKDQAIAAKISADAAKSAADTAKEALHLSERAYLVIGIPELKTAEGVLELPIENTGHIATGSTETYSNSAVYTMGPAMRNNTMVNGWGKNRFISIAPGSGKFSLKIPVPTADLEKLKAGKQFLHIAGKITYTDGFPDTPSQSLKFCFISGVREPAHVIEFNGCDYDIEIYDLQKQTENDNPKYQWPALPIP